MQCLSNRKQVVRVFRDGRSIFFLESVDVKSEVPQGTALGPSLFNIFIYNIPSIVENRIYLYVDDSNIIGSVHFPKSVIAIQVHLGAFSKWNKILVT